MARQNSASRKPQSLAAKIRAALVCKIATHIHTEGEQNTEIPGVSLYRRTSLTLCASSMYEPKLIVFAQGQKRIHCSHATYLCDESTFLLTSVRIPVESQVIVATREKPVLALHLTIDMCTVRDIVNQVNFSPLRIPSGTRGLAIGKTPIDMLDPCLRLLNLMDTPQDIPFLNKQIQQEILYRLLAGPQGDHLRAMAALDEQSHRTAGAIAWLSANFNKPLCVEELASVAHMGISALHHYFWLLTSLTPFQYQRRLRLQMARQRMLVDGVDATRAAFEVGYENANQLNWEYRQFFGQPPLRAVRSRKLSSPDMTTN
jgi:AraC-like DNA-binding protein